MNRSIYRIAVIGVLVGLLASCAKTGELASPLQPEKDVKEKTLDNKTESKDDTNKPDEDGNEPEDDAKDKGEDGGKDDKQETQSLKLNLDLHAEIKQSDAGTLKYQLGKKNAALALIRSIGVESEDIEVIYLPLTLTQSNDDPQKVVAAGVSVPPDKIKADPHKKWEIRLIVGGTWDPKSEQLRFAETDPVVTAEQKSTLHISQPYTSAWEAIPTDAKGAFVASEEGNTNVSLSLHPQSTVLSHHIGVCDAPSDVIIHKIKIETEDMTFGGYYDLSDHRKVGEMKADESFGWHSLPSSAHSVTLNLKTPITLKNGEGLSHHYIYLWGMSDDTAKKHVKVYASGKTTGRDSRDFDDLMIYDKAIPATSGALTEINSTLRIEKPKVEGPITLSTAGDKTTIVADGKDMIKFRVMQSGTDITSECEIFRQEGILDRPVKEQRFTVSSAGTYMFYATKDGKRSNTLTITATKETKKDADGNVTTGLIFCPHVTKDSGWYDVNKVGDGNSSQDGLLCWAAAASNMLEWWLHDYEHKTGHSLPTSVPHGKGRLYALAIFDTFYENWQNYMHSTEPAIRWFLEGGGMKHAASNGSSPTKKGTVSEGGYLKDILSQDAANAYFSSKYVQEYGAYSQWETSVDAQDKATIHKRFSRLLTSILREGPSALSIDSHELTAWGCEVEDGLVTKVYITNSDDGGTRLKSYEVIEQGGRMHLKDYIGKTRYPTQIIRLTGLKGYQR